MYCRHCGKQISETALYCKHCGKKTSPDSAPQVVYKGDSVWTRFNRLSKTKRIIIILYLVYAVIMFRCTFPNFSRDFQYFLEYAIVYPFAIAAIWYVVMMYWKKGTDSQTEANAPRQSAPGAGTAPAEPAMTDGQPSTAPDGNATSAPVIYVTEEEAQALTGGAGDRVVGTDFLTQFAHKRGRMQLVRKTLPDGTDASYCKFTSPDGIETRVELADRVRHLTALEISANKYRLSVKRLDDGRFRLDYTE